MPTLIISIPELSGEDFTLDLLADFSEKAGALLIERIQARFGQEDFLNPPLTPGYQITKSKLLMTGKREARRFSGKAPLQPGVLSGTLMLGFTSKGEGNSILVGLPDDVGISGNFDYGEGILERSQVLESVLAETEDALADLLLDLVMVKMGL